ncbi:MAG: hypothetical protein HOV96_19570 [Nonomuraea sp.]|nr:hypothetical protein [Nonomuraea sp.]
MADGYYDNGIWIALKPECDEPDCEALNDPKTPEEILATLEHWRDHHYLNGCSHGI